MKKISRAVALCACTLLLALSWACDTHDFGELPPPPVPACSDNIDNDGDTLIDVANDPGCLSATDTSELGTNECDDGIDNATDTDTLVDMLDPGCSDPADTTEADGECDDTADNDGDTVADLADPACYGDTAGLTETGECQDGSDNDGDTFMDFPDDPGCTDATDASELGTNECDNGSDDDGDTAIDYPDDLDCDDVLDESEVEECGDGLDNDGDTLFDFPSDPGCDSSLDHTELQVFAKIGSDVRVTSGINNESSASLVWTGSEYGVSWNDNRDGNYEIYFARLDASGAKISSDVRVTNALGYSAEPSLVWTGSGFGVSWDDNRNGNTEIYFARIDASGNKVGGDIRITNDPSASYSPSLVWTGSEFGLSWEDFRDDFDQVCDIYLWPRDCNNEIYFARIDASGNKIGIDMRVSNDPLESSLSSLVWTGSEFGVSWYDDRDGNYEIYFARLNASGTKIGSDVRVTNAPWESSVPSLVWAGSELGVSWNDYRDGNYEIYFIRLDASSTKLEPDIRITNALGISGWPSLVWAGTKYGLAWEDGRDGNTEIYFALLDASGAKIGGNMRITDDPANSYWPSLIWTGSEFGIAWEDRRDGISYKIYFARLGWTAPQCDDGIDNDGDTFIDYAADPECSSYSDNTE